MRGGVQRPDARLPRLRLRGRDLRIEQHAAPGAVPTLELVLVQQQVHQGTGLGGGSGTQGAGFTPVAVALAQDVAAPGALDPGAFAEVTQNEGLLERMADGARSRGGRLGRGRPAGDRRLPLALEGLALLPGAGVVYPFTLREHDAVDGIRGFPRHQAVHHVHGHALRFPLQRIAVAAAVGAPEIKQVVGAQAEVAVAQQVVGAAGFRQLVGKGLGGHGLAARRCPPLAPGCWARPGWPP